MSVLKTCFGAFAVISNSTTPVQTPPYPTLVDTRILTTALNVPAAVSKTQKDIPLPLPARAVILYSTQADISITTCALNGTSLINSFLKYTSNDLLTSKEQFFLVHPDVETITTSVPFNPPTSSHVLLDRVIEANLSTGVYLPRADIYAPSVIAVTSGENMFQLMSKDMSIPREELNIPDAYLQAFTSYILAHEIGHGHNEIKLEGSKSIEILARGLQSEIDADHIALSTYFNNDFVKFVYDWRALTALRHNSNRHFTHIWQEEIASGLPNDEEAQKIIQARYNVISRIRRAVDGYFFNFTHRSLGERSDDRVMKIETNHLNFYAALRYLNDNNVFDEGTYEKEFVVKYIAAFQNLTKERYHNSAEVNELITFYQEIDLKNKSTHFMPADYFPQLHAPIPH